MSAGLSLLAAGKTHLAIEYLAKLLGAADGEGPARQRVDLPLKPHDLASAAASTASLSSPLASVISSRRLPATWITIVTSSSASSAGFTAGHAASATRSVVRRASGSPAHASSARCGIIGATSRIKIGRASGRERGCQYV